ncbi:MAG: Mut7-C RNAse domain-containing protein [Candidatus Nezhaarchaeota archaeon]|nr:Mut7-C RNAse domain-containing protein [Candidatus Nezhaarchaeota archaeon]
MNTEKLLLDGMCGKLARWLRFLGLDVEYLKEADDETLILRAEETGRVIVTRDQDLHLRAVKKGVKSILLTSTDHVDNMSKLLRELNVKIELPPKETRCPLCNSKLREVDPEPVMHLLPSRDIAQRYKKFWLCESCKKVYWIGSHWRNIKKVLSQVERCIEEG